MKRIRHSIAAAAALAGALCAMPAQASLATFQSFVGQYGVSTDGWGSTTQAGVISANVPVGATVVAAYLYTSTFGNGFAGAGGTFNGSAVSYTGLGLNGGLQAGRTNVTSLVKAVTDVGPGGLYNFNITEDSRNQDGSALVVIYQSAALANSSVGILDGFSASAGDSTAINFSSPLNPAAPGFFAEMRLGIGFSAGSGSQSSTVKVNSTTITTNAGNNDDKADATAGNGNLITMGGDDDAFSPSNPSYAQDTERYNLVPYITNGDTSISINTLNPSRDDNIFLAVFHVSGVAGFNQDPNAVPEPGSLALAGLGLLGLGFARRRRAQA